MKGPAARFDALYAKTGRLSFAPEKLLRALLQVLSSIRSKWMPMDQLGYNLVFHWFVGVITVAPRAVTIWVLRQLIGVLR